MSRFWLVYSITVICNYNFVVSVEADQSLHREDLAGEIATMKNTIKVLSDQWEKWNTLFVTSLEPRITSTASTLSSIDSNIHNLQERAHVWDTFQLHVAAWNDQLASMDRKIDILNKALEQLTTLDNKMNTMLSEQYKLDKLIKMTNSLSDTAINIENAVKARQHCKLAKDSLFEEFAARGILSSLKLIERKVDQLLSTRQSNNTRVVNEEPVVKYAIPQSTQNLISDIASKVDIIFDHVSKVNENDYSDEYIDVKDMEGSGSGASPNQFQRSSGHKQNAFLFQMNRICKSVDQEIKEITDRISNIDRNVHSLLKSKQAHPSASNTVARNDLINLLKQFSNTIIVNQTKNVNLVLDSYFHEDRAHWLSIFNTLHQKCFPTSTYSAPTVTSKYTESTTSVSDINSFTENVYITNSYDTKTEPILHEHDISLPTTVNKSSCSDLDHDSPSGIYVFKNISANFANERFFNKQFCEMRENGHWIVIQRRDNYSIQQDFNVSWHDYKLGFGDLQKDFWIGNNYLSRLSSNNNLTLRIELEDFDGKKVWAEYKTFKVADESKKFQLIVRGYSGNSSDALSSHSGSLFSAYDKKNDYAPECCPCSVSYGGGWWFNRCFESNLNGVYYKKPFENEYFRGIIWEHWLGNYSLKKSLMMVKPTGSTQFYSSSNVTRHEDP